MISSLLPLLGSIWAFVFIIGGSSTPDANIYDLWDSVSISQAGQFLLNISVHNYVHTLSSNITESYFVWLG